MDGGMDNKHKHTNTQTHKHTNTTAGSLPLLSSPPLRLHSPLVCGSLSHKCVHTFRQTYIHTAPSLPPSPSSIALIRTQKPPHHTHHSITPSYYLIAAMPRRQSIAILFLLAMASLTHSFTYCASVSQG